MPKGITYVAPVWVNDNEPDLSAENLNPVMAEIEALDKAVFWNTGNTYVSGDVVLYAGAAYASLQDANSGHTPGATPTWWLKLADSGTTNAWETGRVYGLNAPCTKDGIPYRSLVAGNTGNDPATNPDKWEVVGGSGQGVENFLRNALTKANTVGVTATGLTSAAWSTDASAVKLLAAGALKAVVPSSGTRTLDIALSDLDAINVGLVWELRFAYLIDTAGADGLVAVSLYDGTTDVATSLAALPYAGGTAQMTVGTVIPTTTLSGQRLRFTFSGSTGFNFYLAKASVGPKTAVLAPAIGATQTYPLTIGAVTTAPAKGTVAEDVATYAQRGDKMAWTYKYRHTAAGSAGSGAYLFPLPSGYSIDLARHPVGAVVGHGEASATAPIGTAPSALVTIYVYSATQLAAKYLEATYASNTLPDVGSGGYSLSNVTILFNFMAEFTIAQWSVNVNLAGDFTEYASNYSTADANDDTSFYNGADGSSAMFSLTATRLRRIQFTRPIQPSDMLFLEFFDDVSRNWLSGAYLSLSSGNQGIASNGTTGASLYFSAGITDRRQMYVIFCQYRLSTVAWNGSGMTGLKWRVRKVSVGNMAEVPPVVRAEYKNQTTTAAGSPFNYSTRVEDTQNAVTVGASWKFTAPIDGVYLLIAEAVSVTTSASRFALYKNGILYQYIGTVPNTSGVRGFGTVTIRLKAGEYVDVRSIDYGVSTSEDGRISITRIGS